MYIERLLILQNDQHKKASNIKSYLRRQDKMKTLL